MKVSTTKAESILPCMLISERLQNRMEKKRVKSRGTSSSNFWPGFAILFVRLQQIPMQHLWKIQPGQKLKKLQSRIEGISLDYYFSIVFEIVKNVAFCNIDSMDRDNYGWTTLIQCTKIIMAELHFSFLVTLFDRFRFSKTRQNWPFFGIFNELLSAQNVSVARFARNVECDFFCDFQTLWTTGK